MQAYQIEIEIENQNRKSQAVSVMLLQSLLSVLIEGSKGAIRLRAEGRSTVRGAPPQWIKAATTFSMEFKEDKLYVESPTLQEVTPELFEQSNWYPELNSEKTSLDYLQESLISVIDKNMPDNFYDKPLLDIFQDFRHVFSQGANAIRFLGGNRLQITPEIISTFKEITKDIPFPCQVKVAGKLDSIRTHDRIFKLLTAKEEHVIKGIAKPITPKEAQAILNKEVLISGVAHFTLSGKILRLESEQISIAGEQDLELWGNLPVPMPNNAHIAKI